MKSRQLDERSRPVRLDLHVHTMWSGDSTTTPAELAEAVAASAIDAVAITDHNTVTGALALRDSGQLGCPVIVGQEIRTRSGDLIGLYLSDRVPAGLAPGDAARAIRDQGGLVYAPHPDDDSRHSLSPGALADMAGDGLLDVVEVLNAKRKNRYKGELHGAAAAGASDAHVAEALGAAWTEAEPFDLADPKALLNALRTGRVGGGHYDPPRRWTPRIIPAGLSAVPSRASAPDSSDSVGG